MRFLGMLMDGDGVIGVRKLECRSAMKVLQQALWRADSVRWEGCWHELDRSVEVVVPNAFLQLLPLDASSPLSGELPRGLSPLLICSVLQPVPLGLAQQLLGRMVSDKAKTGSGQQAREGGLTARLDVLLIPES